MKNVTPKAGQVWGIPSNYQRTVGRVDGQCVFWTDNSYTWLNELQEYFEFIPQNDLEYLAVNCAKWINERGFGFISRNKPQRADQWNDFGFSVGSGSSGYYTRQQWQNTRYELGLDERTPKEAYREFDKQTKRDLEEAEIRNCPVRGPILKQIDEAISKSRKELCDYFRSDEKLMSIKEYFFDEIKKEDKMKGKFKIGDLINPKLQEQVIRCSTSGTIINFTIESNVTRFFKEVTLEVVNIYVSDNKKMDDLLICINPDVGTHEWFQIKTSDATLKHKPSTKKDTKIIDFSTVKVGDPAKAFRELTKVIDNLNKQKETKMINLTIGSTVIVDGGRDRWGDADHLVDVPVQVMAVFDGLGLDDGKSIRMVAVSDKNGSSCCFRADMCQVVDPRHWLKDLPDADLFDDSVSHIRNNGDLWEYCTASGEFWHQILLIKMPKLTGDEWKLSKISIPYLKAWQEQNK
jgi:hypothetical protein